MSNHLRFDGETDEEFATRARNAAQVAKILVDGCLTNRCMQKYIADPHLPHTAESVLCNPTVRVEYEQAIAIGGIGECLAATKSKNWGAGPSVMPLETDDWFFSDRITYIFRPNSLYNRRFHQRRRMKALLGRHRNLVGEAKASTKGDFLKRVTKDQVAAIRRVLQVGPTVFWRAAKGALFVPLPPEMVQGEFEFAE